MTGILDKLNSLFEDTIDFWSGQHPAKRIAKFRNWSVPQIAGYENSPKYKEILDAFNKVPYSSKLEDFILANDINNTNAVGKYNISTGVATVIPLSPKNMTKAITAHELGHNFLRYRKTRQNEIDPDIIAGAVLNNEDPFDMYKKIQDRKEAAKYYNKAINDNIPSGGEVPTIKRNGRLFYKSQWK